MIASPRSSPSALAPDLLGAHPPGTVGIVVACMLTLTSIAVVVMLIQLQAVLVPLTFAVFLAFLCEPILRGIVFAPEVLSALCQRLLCGRGARRGGAGGRGDRPGVVGAQLGHNAVDDAAIRGLADGEVTDDGSAAALALDGGGSGRDGEAPITAQGCCVRAKQRLRMTWDVISILLCVVAVLGLISAVVLGFYASVNSCDWSKYEDSPKIEEIKDLMKRLGINETNWEDALKHYQGEVTSVATSMLEVAGNVVVTLLLFFFCLVAILPGIHQNLPRARMMTMMQRYLLVKSCTSLIIALCVMVSLWIMDVDLVVIFGMLTFLFNFIPNIGSLFAIIAPAVLVYLTPGKNYQDVVLVVVVPFLIHNTLGCTLEPQMMKAGLDLHPLTTVVALTFWGAVWGVSGMVLSVPITCAIRLALEEVNHPHAWALYDLLEHPLGGSTARKRISPRGNFLDADSSASSREGTD